MMRSSSINLKNLIRTLPRTGSFRPREAATTENDTTAEARFLDALATDARSDHARLRRLTGHLRDQDEPLRIPAFTLERDWMPSARARPSGHVTLSAGMLLCIEQTLLRAMADESFLDLFDAATEWQGGRAPRILRRDSKGTPDLLELLPPTLRPKAAVLPLDSWRACQFELLRTLAVQWVHLHEAAHVLEGHIGLLLDMVPERHRSAFRDLGLAESAGVQDLGAKDVLLPELRRRTTLFGDAPRLSDLRRALDPDDGKAFVTTDARDLHASIDQVNALEDVLAPYRAASRSRRPRRSHGSEAIDRQS